MMDLAPLDRTVARRAISHLKAGTTPIDCVEYVNVGNERWYSAASELFGEIETDGDALVRFINGYYGDGKTHFMGMLRSMALNRGWFVTYLTAERTPLHKFDVVYSELVKGLCAPPNLVIPPWLSVAGTSTRKGAQGILAAVFARFYLEATRSTDKGGLHKERVLEALRKKASDLAASPHLYEALGRAIKAYVEAVIRSDTEQAHGISAWLEGENVTLPNVGLVRRIDSKLSRDAMRGISVLIRTAGAGGVLILLDEAERIMEQTRSVRNKSYGVIRDLLDNADFQGGMQSSVTYVAGTPDLFHSAKGFPEYDALRSRLASSANAASPNLVDWRGVIVDLTKIPMGHDMLIKMAGRVIDLHAAAREWEPRQYLTQNVVSQIVENIEAGASAVTKPRLLAACVANLLEIVEQNRTADINEVLNATLTSVQALLLKTVRVEEWD